MVPSGGRLKAEKGDGGLGFCLSYDEQRGKLALMIYAKSKDPDQLTHPCSLI